MFPNVIKHKVTPRKEKPMLSLTEIQFPFPAFQKIFKKENRSVSSKEQKEYYYSEKKKKSMAWNSPLGLQICGLFDFKEAAAIEKTHEIQTQRGAHGDHSEVCLWESGQPS